MTKTAGKQRSIELRALSKQWKKVERRHSIQRVFENHHGNMSDKWEQYLSIYDVELFYLLARGRPLHLLEIGVQNGGSLEIWQKFLPEGSTVTGIDIDARCRRVAFKGNVTVLIGNAADPDTLNELLEDKVFDIIIDDGSHRQSDIISTFRSLFSRLADGGVFFIEDLHASYWESHGGGLRKPGTAVEFFKEMIDALNLNYFQEGDFQTAEAKFEAQLFNRHVARISFYDSIAVVNKYPTPRTKPFRRLVSGTHMRVTRPLDYLEALIAVPGSFGAIGEIADELVHKAAEELSRARSEVVMLRDSLSTSGSTIESLQQSLAERTTKLANAESELDSSAARVEELLGQLSERERQIEKLEQEATAAVATIESQRGQLAEREERVRDVEQAVATALVDNDTLRNQLSASELKGEELERAVAAISASSDARSSQLSEYERRIADFQGKLDSQSQQLEVRSQLLESVSEQLAEAKLKEEQAQLINSTLNQSLTQIHRAWIFRVDAALMRSTSMSAFGLAKPKSLLRISVKPDNNDKTSAEGRE
ncbi:MAG: class I SAM-dependent methyltransferase [Proteobacteria bacterium]|nr:class I SAM-dependent methyltransferase [Pseudomonadota bacterium]